MTFSVGHIVYFVASQLLLIIYMTYVLDMTYSLYNCCFLKRKNKQANKKNRHKTLPSLANTATLTGLAACGCYGSGGARGLSYNHLVKCALRSRAETRIGTEAKESEVILQHGGAQTELWQGLEITVTAVCAALYFAPPLATPL